MRYLLGYLVAPILAACGPERGSGGTDTGSDSDTDGTTGDPPAEVSECSDRDPDAAQLCGPVGLGCEVESCDPDLWWAVDDEADLECTL